MPTESVNPGVPLLIVRKYKSGLRPVSQDPEIPEANKTMSQSAGRDDGSSRFGAARFPLPASAVPGAAPLASRCPRASEEADDNLGSDAS